MNFVMRAAASMTAAAVLLTGCGWSGATNPIPKSERPASSSAASSMTQTVAQCYALQPGGARCASLVLDMPAGAKVAADGKIVTIASNEQLFANLTTHKWLVQSSGIFYIWPRSATRRASYIPDAFGDGSGGGRCAADCFAGATPGPLPAGAQTGTDGNAWDAQGREMGWCGDCGADGNGAWIYYIGSVSNYNPPYEGDMSPYLTAAQFGDNLAPWFYTFAVPIDIPIGGFLARFGGKFAGRIGATRVGRWMIAVKSAVPASQITEKTAFAINQELAKLGMTDAPFAASSKVLDVVLDDAAAAALNAQFSGDLELVRATGNPFALDGNWWTARAAISDINGGLLSAAEIADRLALPNPASQMYLITGGQIQAGSGLYIGIVNQQSYGTGGVIQIFVKSGGIQGGGRVPIQ
jgi:hypothetical protein